MIVDATPRAAVQTGSSWWSARSPKLRVRHAITGVALTARPADPLERGMALFQAGDLTRAMPLIGRAAVAGNARAQYLFATALFNGDGVPRDWTLAEGLMRLAARRGIAEAEESLALMADLLAPAAPAPTASATDAAPDKLARLVSPAAAAAIAHDIAALAAPPPPPDTVEGTVRSILLPMLRQSLERLLPDAFARRVSAAIAQGAPDRS